MECKDDVKKYGSFCRILELDVQETSFHPDAFDRIREGELQGILIHNVYSSEILDVVVDQFERHDPPFVQTWFPKPFKSWFYGRNLNLNMLELSDYFKDAAIFHEQLKSLLPDELGLTTYVADLLSSLDRQRKFQSPAGPNAGERYMFTTIRAHEEGGFIPAHCDNEQKFRPSYQHLLTLIDSHLFSFVLPFTQVEAGGELEIFNYQLDHEGTELMNDDRYESTFDSSKIESVRFHLPAGSLIVVDSGKYLHQVTPVRGSIKRWNACSFMAMSKTGDAMYCWG